MRTRGHQPASVSTFHGQENLSGDTRSAELARVNGDNAVVRNETEPVAVALDLRTEERNLREPVERGKKSAKGGRDLIPGDVLNVW